MRAAKKRCTTKGTEIMEKNALTLLCSTSSWDVVVSRRFFFSVSSVPGRKPNTEVTETFRDLCVKAFEAQSTRRSSFWLRLCRAVMSVPSVVNVLLG